MPISLSKKTGFRVENPDEPVVILDERMGTFYDTWNILPVKKFNLPPGDYFLTMGKITPLSSPVNHTLSILPIAERLTYPNPQNFEVVYGQTPHKCNVLWDDKKILFDISCRSLPKFMQYFMLFHEFGHEHYDTEEYCDLYANNAMLKYGFNPSQIKAAKDYGLDERNRERKDFMEYIILTQNGSKKN